jgi:hypothetical protein
MNRKETTEFLSDLLIRDRFSGAGKYYAKEVVLDWGLAHPKRVDFLQYIPNGATYVGDIESGRFICYEIKSCREDVYSGNGLNFFGDENYIVTTMECYKSLLPDMQSGKFSKHIVEMNDGKSRPCDFLIAVPDRTGFERFNPSNAILEEFENPTQLDDYSNWRLAKQMMGNRKSCRIRSTTELLFCMVRSGR